MELFTGLSLLWYIFSQHQFLGEARELPSESLGAIYVPAVRSSIVEKGWAWRNAPEMAHLKALLQGRCYDSMDILRSST